MTLPAIVPPGIPVARAARKERVDAPHEAARQPRDRIEDLAVRLCAIAGGVPSHRYENRAILIGAGDHGVARDGVSAYPPEGDRTDGRRILRGNGGDQRLCARGAGPRIRRRFRRRRRSWRRILALFDLKVARGATASLASGDAMTHAQAERAPAAGLSRVRARRRASPAARVAGTRRNGNREHDTGGGAHRLAHENTRGPDRRAWNGDRRRTLRTKAACIVETAVERAPAGDPMALAAALGGYEIVGLAGDRCWRRQPAAFR